MMFEENRNGARISNKSFCNVRQSLAESSPNVDGISHSNLSKILQHSENRKERKAKNEIGARFELDFHQMKVRQLDENPVENSEFDATQKLSLTMPFKPALAGGRANSTVRAAPSMSPASPSSSPPEAPRSRSFVGTQEPVEVMK